MKPLNKKLKVISDVQTLASKDKKSEIRLNANGGNSILLVCEPIRELEYILQLKTELNDDEFLIIDLNQLLIEFVSTSAKMITELFELLQSSTPEIFKAPEEEKTADLFKAIIAKIQEALDNNKIPTLINTGSLYGSGIQNIHIMENPVVMNAPLPIIILYPATRESDRIMFLGKHPSSKYRCMIIH